MKILQKKPFKLALIPNSNTKPPRIVSVLEMQKLCWFVWRRKKTWCCKRCCTNQRERSKRYCWKICSESFYTRQALCRKRQSSESRKSSIPFAAVRSWSGWKIKRWICAVYNLEETTPKQILDEAEVHRTEDGRILKVDDCDLGRNSRKITQAYN